METTCCGPSPRPGMTLTAAGHLWTVADMEGPRILKIKAQPREL
jgi:hypothetical protein